MLGDLAGDWQNPINGAHKAIEQSGSTPSSFPGPQLQQFHDLRVAQLKIKEVAHFQPIMPFLACHAKGSGFLQITLRKGGLAIVDFYQTSQRQQLRGENSLPSSGWSF